MNTVAKCTAAICILCKCGLDITQPHAIVKHDYAHLTCAEKYDSRDLGAVELPDEAHWTDEILEDDLDELRGY